MPSHHLARSGPLKNERVVVITSSNQLLPTMSECKGRWCVSQAGRDRGTRRLRVLDSSTRVLIRYGCNKASNRHQELELHFYPP